MATQGNMRDNRNEQSTTPGVTMAERHIQAALKYLAAAREQLAIAQTQVTELQRQVEHTASERTHTFPPLAISVAQAAKALGVSSTVMYRLLMSGTLKSFKIGGRRIVPVKALDEFLANGLEDARF